MMAHVIGSASVQLSIINTAIDPHYTVTKRKYWYVTYIDECPVCGRSDKWRERVYEKPDSPIHYEQVYDWCDV